MNCHYPSVLVLCMAALLAGCGNGDSAGDPAATMQPPAAQPVRVAVYADNVSPLLILWLPFQAKELGLPELDFERFDGAPDALLANIANFDVVIIADGFQLGDGLMAFDGADMAGVPVLSIGNGRTGNSLAKELENDARYGIDTADDYNCDIIQVTIEAGAANHPIFDGLNTAQSILFETSLAAENDEEHFSVTGPDTPADWTVLARISDTPGACYQLAICMAEFTTSNGTRVILDGSANTYDSYDYWAEARWRVTVQQLLYLAGRLP